MKQIRKNKHKKWNQNKNKSQSLSEDESIDNLQEISFIQSFFSSDLKEQEVSLGMICNFSKQMSESDLNQLLKNEVIVKLVGNINMKESNNQIRLNSIFGLINMVKISEDKGMVFGILNELQKQNVVQVIVRQMQESSVQILMEKENKVLFEKSENNYILSGLVELSECVLEAIPSGQTGLGEYSELIEILCRSLQLHQEDQQIVFNILSLMLLFSNKLPLSSPQFLHLLPFLTTIFHNPFYKLYHQQQKSIILVLLFNLSNHTNQSIDHQFIVINLNNILKVKIIDEFDNLKAILLNDKKQENKLAEQSTQVVQIWEDSALSILQVLEFLNKVLEVQVEEEESVEEMSEEQMEEEEEELIHEQGKNDEKVKQQMMAHLNTKMQNKSQAEYQLIKTLFFHYGQELMDILSDKILCLDNANITFIHQYHKINFISLYIQQINQQSTTLLNTIITQHSIQYNHNNIFHLLMRNLDKFDSLNFISQDSQILLLDQLELIYFILQSYSVNLNSPQQVLDVLKKILIYQLDSKWSNENIQFVAVIIDIIVIVFGPLKKKLQFNNDVCQVLMDLTKVDQFYILSLAINGIFEVYSDEDYNQVFHHNNLVQYLQQLQPLYLQKLKLQQQSQDFKYYKETELNLRRFIKYKINNP